MELLRQDPNQARIIIGILLGFVLGVVFGLVPLVYGRMKGKGKLGLIGFVVSVLSGTLIWAILPLFVMLTFVFLILKKDQPQIPPADDVEPVEND